MENKQNTNTSSSEELVNSLKVEIADLKSGCADRDQVIGDLKEKLASALTQKAAASKKPTVVVDGETYEVNHGAAPYTVDELAANPEACKQILVIKGQNALSKVV